MKRFVSRGAIVPRLWPWFLAVSICLHQETFPQVGPAEMLTEARYLEEVRGEPDQALGLCARILADPTCTRAIAAHTWLLRGNCLELLGRPGAGDAYRIILKEFPDLEAPCAAARDQLTALHDQGTLHPLTQYYLDRIGYDILTSRSFDGRLIAFTDWATGNLAIRDRRTGAVFPLTSTDWSLSHEHAHHPAWSRGGGHIAYGWYRAPYFVELRVISLPEGEIRILHTDSTRIIAPHDWSPDSSLIACLSGNLARSQPDELILVETATGAVRKVTTVGRNCRGISFSPDGRYLAYEVQEGGGGLLRVYDLATGRTSSLGEGLPGISRYDSPVWSPDERLIMCRNSGTYDLWALPMKAGTQEGKPFLLQRDLAQLLLRLNRADHTPLQPRSVQPSRDTPVPPFVEEFRTPHLDPSWVVCSWNRPDVYGCGTFGDYSLTARPGFLRFILGAGMSPPYENAYRPVFSGWYWIYPGLELRRPIGGTRWTIESRVTYVMLDGVAGRSLNLNVYFGADRDPPTILLISRVKDIDPETNHLRTRLVHKGMLVAANHFCRAPGDTLGVQNVEYFFRITREDSVLSVDTSVDGLEFREVFVATLPAEVRGRSQAVALTGDSWFAPAGAHADWDYIRFSVHRP